MITSTKLVFLITVSFLVIQNMITASYEDRLKTMQTRSINFWLTPKTVQSWSINFGLMPKTVQSWSINFCLIMQKNCSIRFWFIPKMVQTCSKLLAHTINCSDVIHKLWAFAKNGSDLFYYILAHTKKCADIICSINFWLILKTVQVCSINLIGAHAKNRADMFHNTFVHTKNGWDLFHTKHNRTDSQNVTDILLKVALNTKNTFTKEPFHRHRFRPIKQV